MVTSSLLDPYFRVLKDVHLFLINCLQNAFSDRLSKFGFDPFKMLVPDFMHEFELGVFKAFFVHLLRILHARGNGAIQELNQR